MLAARVFPVGNFIRTREQLDYLEAPDCFHDMFGHIPMLAHHDYAEMTRHVGELGLAAIAANRGHKAARLYWHSVEFGLARMVEGAVADEPVEVRVFRDDEAAAWRWLTEPGSPAEAE